MVNRFTKIILVLGLAPVRCGGEASNLQVSTQNIEAVQKKNAVATASTTTTASDTSTQTSVNTDLLEIVRDATSKIVGLFLDEDGDFFFLQDTDRQNFFSVNKTTGLTQSTPVHFADAGCTGPSFIHSLRPTVDNSPPFVYRLNDPAKTPDQQSLYRLTTATAVFSPLLSTQDGGACQNLMQNWGADNGERDVILELNLGEEATLFHAYLDSSHLYITTCVPSSSKLCIAASDWSSPQTLVTAAGITSLSGTVFISRSGKLMYLSYFNGGTQLVTLSCGEARDCTQPGNWLTGVTASIPGAIDNTILVSATGSLFVFFYQGLSNTRGVYACSQNTDCALAGNWTGNDGLGGGGTGLQVVSNGNNLIQIFQQTPGSASLQVSVCPMTTGSVACIGGPAWTQYQPAIGSNVSSLSAASTADFLYMVYHADLTNDTRLFTCTTVSCQAGAFSSPIVIGQADGAPFIVPINEQLYVLTDTTRLLHCSGLTDGCLRSDGWTESEPLFPAIEPLSAFFGTITTVYLDRLWFTYRGIGTSRYALQLPHGFSYPLSSFAGGSLILPAYPPVLLKDTLSP